jgi:hypothetical protein
MEVRGLVEGRLGVRRLEASKYPFAFGNGRRLLPRRCVACHSTSPNPLLEGTASEIAYLVRGLFASQ